MSINECCICLEYIDKEDLYILDCNHVFHSTCLSQCRKLTCPLCRRKFTPYMEAYLLEIECIKPIKKNMLTYHFPDLSRQCVNFINKNEKTIILYFNVSLHRDNWYKCFQSQKEILNLSKYTEVIKND